MATYIKNKGITQTVFSNNNHKTRNEIKWNAAYDGNHANIKVDLNDNGKKNKYRMQLNNKDLANLLSIPTVNKPLKTRLTQDFLTDFDILDEEDLELLPQPQELQIQECYKPHSEFPPESALFRVNIPQTIEKKEALRSPFPTPCPYTSDICSIQDLPELNSLSRLTSMTNPNPTPTSRITKLEPLTIPYQISEEITNPFSEKPIQISEQNVLTKREKNARLKTPSPKTLRIHYTTARGKGRKTRRKRRTNKKQNKFTKFFNKLF
jgi:hypothetical protein